MEQIQSLTAKSAACKNSNAFFRPTFKMASSVDRSQAAVVIDPEGGGPDVLNDTPTEWLTILSANHQGIVTLYDVAEAKSLNVAKSGGSQTIKSVQDVSGKSDMYCCCATIGNEGVIAFQEGSVEGSVFRFDKVCTWSGHRDKLGIVTRTANVLTASLQPV